MQHLAYLLIYPVGSILGAHALTYLLAGALPQAAIAALGLFSADETILAAFASSNQSRTYLETLIGLPVGDLGRTLDGQTVTFELGRALLESAPRIAASLVILVSLCAVTAFLVREKGMGVKRVGDFVAFLPPYVAPFLGFVVVLGVQFFGGIAISRAVYEVIGVLALSTGGGALLAAQTARITQRNLASDFARSIRAAGATRWQLRMRLIHNLVTEIGPTFEKMVVGLAAALFFVEPILNLGGFGTLAARAVRRSDTDLLLGVTLVVACMVALARVLVATTRLTYGVEE